MRRCLLSVLVLGLTPILGCGFARSFVRNDPTRGMSGPVVRVFPEPVSHVLLDAMDVLGHEFAKIEDLDKNLDIQFYTSTAPVPNGTKPIPLGAKFEMDLVDCNLEAASFRTKTTDGRPVVVRLRAEDQAKATEVEVFVDKSGDPELGRAFLDRVAERLTRPLPGKGNLPDVPGRVPSIVHSDLLGDPAEKKDAQPGRP